MNRQTEPTISLMEYAILRAAIQAQQNLRGRNLDARAIRENLKLLSLGQQIVRRLEKDGFHVPQVDLACPSVDPS